MTTSVGNKLIIHGCTTVIPLIIFSKIPRIWFEPSRYGINPETSTARTEPEPNLVSVDVINALRNGRSLSKGVGGVLFTP